MLRRVTVADEDVLMSNSQVRPANAMVSNFDPLTPTIRFIDLSDATLVQGLHITLIDGQRLASYWKGINTSATRVLEID